MYHVAVSWYCMCAEFNECCGAVTHQLQGGVFFICSGCCLLCF